VAPTLVASLALTDRIWLPGEDPESTLGRTAIAVASRYAEDGTLDHIKVWL
jgi:hypothetical protein